MTHERTRSSARRSWHCCRPNTLTVTAGRIQSLFNGFNAHFNNKLMFTASDYVTVDSCAGGESAAHQICEICQCWGEKRSPEFPPFTGIWFLGGNLKKKQWHQSAGDATGKVSGSSESAESTMDVKITDLNHQNAADKNKRVITGDISSDYNKVTNNNSCTWQIVCF